MTMFKNVLGGLGAIALATVGATAASATDLVPAGSKLDLSANIGGTSDYIFRGFSQTAEDPAVQGGVDATYGLFYAGVWVSNLDFGETSTAGQDVANVELDLYAGVTPKLGQFDFDLGVIWYLYPGARDPGAELDYVELKAAVSTEIFKSLTGGITYYYSPEFTGETGTAHAVEGSLSYELPAIMKVTPSVSGLVGYQQVADLTFSSTDANDDEYLYWNIGLGLAYQNLSLDFRYWDTDMDNAFCSGQLFQCDERFVFSASVSFP